MRPISLYWQCSQATLITILAQTDCLLEGKRRPAWGYIGDPGETPLLQRNLEMSKKHWGSIVNKARLFMPRAVKVVGAYFFVDPAIETTQNCKQTTRNTVSHMGVRTLDVPALESSLV